MLTRPEIVIFQYIKNISKDLVAVLYEIIRYFLARSKGVAIMALICVLIYYFIGGIFEFDLPGAKELTVQSSGKGGKEKIPWHCSRWIRIYEIKKWDILSLRFVVGGRCDSDILAEDLCATSAHACRCCSSPLGCLKATWVHHGGIFLESDPFHSEPTVVFSGVGFQRILWNHFLRKNTFQLTTAVSKLQLQVSRNRKKLAWKTNQFLKVQNYYFQQLILPFPQAQLLPQSTDDAWGSSKGQKCWKKWGTCWMVGRNPVNSPGSGGGSWVPDFISLIFRVSVTS